MATTAILYFLALNVGPNNLAADWDIIMQFCRSVAGNYWT